MNARVSAESGSGAAERAATAGHGRRGAALGVMLASGFAGLGYQLVWTQQSALWLGHEAAALLAVVTAFFGGLALGALALGRRIERSARPERWYAGCELVIATWSVALALLMAPFSTALLALTGAEPGMFRQWAVAFAGTFLLLLPATAAMGATLPAMERVTARLQGHGSPVATLYAANTAGAVLGVLVVAFVLVPELGLARTAAVCAALNLLCAVGALALAAPPLPAAPPVAAGAARRQLPLLAATGLLGIGYEVLVVRVLSQVTEDTVYTFALLLAVYLVGTALGAAACARWITPRGALLHGRNPGRYPSGHAVRDRLLQAVAAAVLLGTASLWAAEDQRSALQQALAAGGVDAMAAALAAEAMLALTAFLLPTVAMGALFSHLATQARAAGIGLGASLGVNTLGAAAAPPVFGVLAVPALGAKGALLLVAAGYLLLCAPRRWPRPVSAGLAAVAAGLAVWAPPLAFVDVPEGGRVLSYREGTMAAVSVVEDAGGVARLRINNRAQEGSSATRLTDARQALLPMLLHPQPRRALFLGLGTGVTATSAALDPTLQVDAAELLPEVIAASALFTHGMHTGTPSPLRVVAADARRYVRTAGPRYDLVVSDNFHPARSGSGSLYTVEHFRAVQARLAPGGLFCQWLPLHQLDLATLRSIVRSFTEVYPGAWAVLATNSLETPVLGLMAHADARRFTLPQAQARIAGHALPHGLEPFGLGDAWALLGSFVAGPQALARLAAGAPLNTDDRPVVAYRAPRITYAPDTLPRERLAALLQALSVTPEEVLAPGADAATSGRLAAYWAARDAFIAAGQAVRPSSDARQMLAQVQAPLMAVLRTSPDFRPAYDPLLRLAGALARSDRAAAATLLNELVRLQPARREATDLLQQLATASGRQAQGVRRHAADTAASRSRPSVGGAVRPETETDQPQRLHPYTEEFSP